MDFHSKGAHRVKIKVCILAGGPRLAKLSRAVGVPTAGFPIAAQVPLVKAWRVDSSGVEIIGRPVLICSNECDNPEEFGIPMSPGIEVVYEQRSHRGTGGVVFDWVHAEPDSADPAHEDYSHVLVLEASAYPGADLGKLFNMASDPEYAAVLGISELGRPAGCTIIRRDLIGLIPDRGFFDLKEQWLSAAVGSGKRVGACSVVERAIRIQTLGDWIAAITAFKASLPSDGIRLASAATGVSCVDPTAVTEGAFLSSAVVMKDAVVEPGAVVVRSAIGPGVIVSSREIIVDRVVSTSSIPWVSENLRKRGELP